MERLPDLAAELVRLRVDVIVAATNPVIAAAKRATATDFERAFVAMNGKRVGAVILLGGAVTYLRRQQIAELALKYRLPAIHSLKEYAQAGLLMTNGPSLLDLFRRAASYVAKILGGAKPRELPVEQPTKFELVINLKTARALAFTIPQSVLLRADAVIE